MLRHILYFLCLVSLAGGVRGHPDTAITARLASVYDGDTFRVHIEGWPPIVGEDIAVRLRGIDTPEIRGAQCPEEKRMAVAARDYLSRLLSAGDAIRLTNVERGKYFRLIADAEVAGKDIKQSMLATNLAREYAGGKRESWCN